MEGRWVSGEMNMVIKGRLRDPYVVGTVQYVCVVDTQTQTQ